jgi:fatty acid desaturase
MSRGRFLFRYTAYDAIPAICGIGIVSTILFSFLHFDSLPAWLAAGLFLAVACSYWWNLQCISHNFIHNPFFAAAWLNRAFSVLETLAIGVPHVFYHHYHMNHHFGDNDYRGADGKTKDWSSIYRYGKHNQPEAFWRYCLFSFFRAQVIPVIRVVIRHGPSEIYQAIAESTVLALFWGAMAFLNWRYFLLFYLPSYYLGWVLSYAEGYLEHYRCQPGNYFANSVSSYNLIYNLLCFNNGYHQEHHWDPKMHWTRMKGLSRQIQPQLLANHTRILKGPHITAFLEDWLGAAWHKSLSQPRQTTKAA